jgi:hypothetical protein
MAKTFTNMRGFSSKKESDREKIVEPLNLEILMLKKRER